MDDLAHRIGDFTERFVVMTPEMHLVAALWVIHTYCFQLFQQTPYLAVTSPEKHCGKSRLLEVLRELVARPWAVTMPSEAVVYRVIADRKPTLLLDEVDAIFGAKASDRTEGLRAMLNAGSRAGTTVPRCVGPNSTVVDFPVFCPKVLAGIGELPDTIADRSIPFRMERRADEPIERFFIREVALPTAELKEEIEAWCVEHGEALSAARPAMPEEMSDREQEGCEPLVAIADELGCGEEARTALVALLGGERADDSSMRIRLLEDLRTWFEWRADANYALTSWLLDALKEIPEAPWSNYYGREFTDRDLATLLKPYRVRSKQIWNDDRTSQHRGYRKEDLLPVWRRYLPPAVPVTSP